MKSFYTYLMENEGEQEVNTMFSQASEEIDKLFGWLYNKMQKSWGGEKGKLAIEAGAKKKAISYLKTVLQMLQQESGGTSETQAEQIAVINQVLFEAEASIGSQLNLQKQGGNYDAKQALDAIKNRIMQVIDKLRGDIIMQSIGQQGREMGGRFDKLQKGFSGVEGGMDRILSGDRAVRVGSQTTHNVVQLANTATSNNLKIWYFTPGRKNPIQLNPQSPSFDKEVENAIRLMGKNKTSRMYIGGSTKDAKEVFVNDDDSVSTVLSSFGGMGDFAGVVGNRRSKVS